MRCDLCKQYSTLTSEYPCGHTFCFPCGVGDLEEKIEEGSSALACPYECQEKLAKTFLQDILSEEHFQCYLLAEKEEKKRERLRRLAELEREKARLLAEEEKEKARLYAVGSPLRFAVRERSKKEEASPLRKKSKIYYSGGGRI